MGMGADRFVRPAQPGATCTEGRCIVSQSEDLMCSTQKDLRTIILGKSKPLDTDADGHIVIPGITVIDSVDPSGSGNVRVRVEDMCGNVGVDVMPL